MSTDLFRKSILFGGDYNPDQWLDRPDILSQDIKLMKMAGVTVVSVGIFSWSTLEPQEGVFCFDWLDEVIEHLHKEGISIFLATPTGARPAWMATKYPQVLRVRADGTRNLFGERHNHCYSSPIYREKTAIINKKLAQRYGNHPAVKLWHISNEYGGQCHCELCQQNFREYLKKRYITLEALNKAWWSTFWSHTITSWDQIHSPVLHGENSVHGLSIDWMRFVTHMTTDFMQHEVAAVRAEKSTLPVTTNMMTSAEDSASDPGLDYWKFKNLIDIASWDSYPAWHLPGHLNLPRNVEAEQKLPVDDYRRAVEEGFQHDLFRSLSDGPFLLMESTPSNVNWQQISKIKKPGMIRLTALSAIAHGANSVQYFQWRKTRGSFEKFHGAFIGHDGKTDNRVFKELSELGSLLKQLSKVADSDVKAEAAVVYNWENRWAIETSKDAVNTNKKAYLETVKKHHYALVQQGIQCDIISGEEPLNQLCSYRLIVAPMLYMATPTTSSNLEKYVGSGGILISTYRTGYVDQSDLCYESFPPGPLSQLFGLEVEECDALYHEEPITIEVPFEANRTSTSINYTQVSDYQDVIRDSYKAEVISRFSGGLAHEKPAVLRNTYGKGEAWYLASRLQAQTLQGLYKNIIQEAKIYSVHTDIANKSPSILVKERTGSDGRRFCFFLNFSATTASVRFTDPHREDITLEPWGSVMVEKDLSPSEAKGVAK